MNIETSLDEMIKSLDWHSAFVEAMYYSNPVERRTVIPLGETVSVKQFSIHDVSEIFYSKNGSDGEAWVAIGKLIDNRYFSIRAGYQSGWDPYTWGVATVASSLEEILDFERIKLQ